MIRTFQPTTKRLKKIDFFFFLLLFSFYSVSHFQRQHSPIPSAVNSQNTFLHSLTGVRKGFCLHWHYLRRFFALNFLFSRSFLHFFFFFAQCFRSQLLCFYCSLKRIHKKNVEWGKMNERMKMKKSEKKTKRQSRKDVNALGATNIVNRQQTSNRLFHLCS